MNELQNEWLKLTTGQRENDDSLLKAFTLTKKYLDVAQRTDVLNQRMSLVKELFELLRSEQQTRHSVKLEIIVIILIVVEVVFEVLVPFMEAYLLKGSGSS